MTKTMSSVVNRIEGLQLSIAHQEMEDLLWQVSLPALYIYTRVITWFTILCSNPIKFPLAINYEFCCTLMEGIEHTSGSLQQVQNTIFVSPLVMHGRIMEQFWWQSTITLLSIGAMSFPTNLNFHRTACNGAIKRLLHPLGKYVKMRTHEHQ